MRAKRKTPVPKDDLSWSEVGEMAYGYLRIPLALAMVEIIYWWATDTPNSFEPYQAGIASLWVALADIIWPNAFELMHYENGALTQVVMSHDTFGYGGKIRVYVSDECVGIHETIFLAVLILLTPGVSNRIRWRSIAVTTLVIQILNFVRLMVLFPLAVSACEGNPNVDGCEAPMFEFHEFILSSGFLVILVFIWLAWYYVLHRKGLVDKSAQPSIADFKKIREIRFRDSLPTPSKAVIAIALLIATWATWSYAIDDENQEWKAGAVNCELDSDDRWVDENGEDCKTSLERWNEIEGRAIRAWLFSAIFIGLSIVTLEPRLEISEEE